MIKQTPMNLLLWIRMQRSLRLAVLAISIVTSCSVVYGQGFFNEEQKLSDLYDNRGFLKGKGVSQSGNLTVSNVNGNIQYQYAISSGSYNGTPINLSLNFNQNASYTSYLSYQNDAWKSFTQNRPVWILGMNGFAIQALHAVERHIQRPEIRARETTEYSYVGEDITKVEFDDADITWTLDGWDVGNTMEDFTVDINNPKYDIIRILRADGSILELVNKASSSQADCGQAYEGCDGAYTGVYVENAINAGGYAIVEFDDRCMMTSYARHITDVTGSSVVKAKYRPRIVRYYPGDGSTYVFYEWKMPYGLRAVAGRTDASSWGLSVEEAGWHKAGPSVFYLDRIEKSGVPILELDRSKHARIIVGNPLHNAPIDDVSAGRAVVTGFDNHIFTWSSQGLTVDNLGSITKIEFTRSINSGALPSYYETFGLCPIGSYGSPYTPDPEWITADEHYASFVGLVTAVTDPAGRRTEFTYTDYERRIKETPYPYTVPSPVLRTDLVMKGSRLTGIKEPDRTIAIEHVAIPSEQSFVGTPPAIGSVDPFYVVSCSKLKFYSPGTSPALLREDIYAPQTDYTYSAYGWTGLARHITHRDIVAGTETEEEFLYQTTAKTPIFPSRPLYHTDVVFHWTDADGVREMQHTVFGDLGNQLSPVMAGVRSVVPLSRTNSTTWMNPITSTQETTPTTRTVYTDYEAESGFPSTIGLDQALIDAFGTRISHRMAANEHWDGSAWVTDTKTEETFENVPHQQETVELHLSIIDKNASRDKLVALLKDDPDAFNEFNRRWVNHNDDAPWLVWREIDREVTVNVDPLWNLPVSTVVRDPSGLVLSGSRTEYNLDLPFGNVGQPTFDYGRPTANYLIGVGGVEVLGASTSYVTVSHNRSWPETVVDANGAATRTYLAPTETWISNGSYTGNILTDNPTSDEVVSKTSQFSSEYGRYYELPFATERSIRAVDPANPFGPLLTKKLRTASRIEKFGTVTQQVDANGWQSEYRYDGIGRLLYAWAPGDFPTTSTSALAVSYGNAETFRSYNLDVYGKQAYEVYDIDCPCSDPEIDITLHDITTKSTNLRRVGWELVDYRPDCSVCDDPTSAVVAGTQQAGRIADATSKGDNAQYIYVPLPEPGLYGPYPLPDRTLFISDRENSFTVRAGMQRWEHEALTTVQLEMDVAEIFGESVVLRFKCDAIGLDELYTFERSDYLDEETAVAPFVLDLEDYISDFEASGASGPESTHYDIEVSSYSVPGYGESAMVEFGNIRLRVEGTFRTWEVRDVQDFTMAMTYHDAQRQVIRYTKVDDERATANDYTALSVSGLPYRHAKGITTFGAEGTMVEDRSQFPLSVYSPISSMSSADAVVSSSYNGRGLTTTVTDALSNPTDVSYDETGRSTVTTHPYVAYAGIGACTPAMFQTRAITQANYSVGNRVTFGLLDALQPDFQGLVRRTSSIAEDGRTVVQYTDVLGRLRRQIDSYNPFTYVAANPYSSPATDENLVTMYDYDRLGRAIRVTNPNGQETQYWYDDFGRVRYKHQADIGATSYAYDATGNLRFSQTQAQANTSKMSYYQYDDARRPIVVGEVEIDDTNPPAVPDDVGNHLAGPYDPYLNVQRFTDRFDPNVLHVNLTPAPPLTVNPTLWQVPLSAYSILWNITQGTTTTPCADLLVQSTDNRFNPAIPPSGNVLRHPAVTVNRGSISVDDYDFEDLHWYPNTLLTQAHYDEMPTPANVTVAWRYFPATSVWDAIAGNREGKVRNLKGRVAAIAYRGHGPQPFHYVVKSYDERGRMESLLRRTEDIGFDAIYYTYNSNNQVTCIRVVDPINQHYTWYGYDDQGRIASVRTALDANGFGVGANPVLPTPLAQNFSDPADMTYTYDAKNQLVTVAYPRSGVTSTSTYNARGWKTELEVENAMSQVLFSQKLAFSNTGRIENQCWQHRGGAPRTETYAYDDANRLVSFVDNLGGTNTYTYDKIGNRLTDMTDGALRTFAYGTTLGAPGPNGLAAVNGTQHDATLTYDANGAIAGRITRETDGVSASHAIETFEYDVSGLVARYRRRLARGPQPAPGGCLVDASTVPISDWRYRYGPMMEREQKRQYDGGIAAAAGGRAWTYYLLGGDKRQHAVWNGFFSSSLCSPASNMATMWPVEYNAYGVAGSRMINRADGVGREYVIADHLGSTRLVIDANGLPLEQKDYEPFGGVVASRGEGARTSYIGRETDNESDLGAYGVRQYDAEYGRFLSVDPLWEKFSSWSVYSYSLNNPLAFSDGDGRQPRAFKLNNHEKYLVMIYPFEAIGIRSATIAAAEATVNVTKGTFLSMLGGHNDAVDAIRHTIWAAISADKVGVDVAKQFLDAHETGDKRQPEDEKKMDLHNNWIGYEIAADHPGADPDEYAKLAYQAYLDGKLVLSPQQAYEKYGEGLPKETPAPTVGPYGQPRQKNTVENREKSPRDTAGSNDSNKPAPTRPN